LWCGGRAGSYDDEDGEDDDDDDDEAQDCQKLASSANLFS
jgi:hypothetical protein